MFSVIKPQAPFERLKMANDSPEVALARAIILQAIVDASNTASSSHAQQCAGEALEWIFEENDHFKEICVSADLEADFVRSIALKMIELHKNRYNAYM
jgi:hypothetical protein